MAIKENMERMDYVHKDLEDYVTWIDNCYACNEIVDIEDLLPDDINIEDML